MKTADGQRGERMNPGSACKACKDQYERADERRNTKQTSSGWPISCSAINFAIPLLAKLVAAVQEAQQSSQSRVERIASPSSTSGWPGA
jgi:hypothetical protein